MAAARPVAPPIVPRPEVTPPHPVAPPQLRPEFVNVWPRPEVTPPQPVAPNATGATDGADVVAPTAIFVTVIISVIVLCGLVLLDFASGPSSPTVLPAPVAQPPAPPAGDGLNDCGPTSNESCAVSLLVTGGTFNRGTDTANPATISDFRLDKVTVHTLSGGEDVP